MLGKVGPVIAQRDSVVKRLFGRKEDGQMKTLKHAGVDSYRAILHFFCTGRRMQKKTENQAQMHLRLTQLMEKLVS